MLTKKEAKILTERLDRIANAVQRNPSSYSMTKKAAHDFCFQLDKTSDMIETTLGLDSFPPVLQHDADEDYMAHFEDDETLGVREVVESSDWSLEEEDDAAWLEASEDVDPWEGDEGAEGEADPFEEGEAFGGASHGDWWA